MCVCVCVCVSVQDCEYMYTYVRVYVFCMCAPNITHLLFSPTPCSVLALLMYPLELARQITLIDHGQCAAQQDVHS